MKKNLVLLMVLVAVALMATTAMADTVTFSTAGSFSCGTYAGPCALSGPGNDVVKVGLANSFTLSFNGILSSTVHTIAGPDFSAPYSNASFGFINAQATGAGQTLGLQHLDFVLTITQTVPGPTGSDTLAGFITGTVTVDASTGDLHFLLGDIPARINGISYFPVVNDLIVSPSTLNGISTVNGAVVSPEPASLALFGSGLLMGGNFIRRKLKA